jgi:hypothetical protein
MTQKIYVEDVFVDFFKHITDISAVLDNDYKALSDFYDKLSFGEDLTQNQGKYLLGLISRYRSYSLCSYDIESILKNPIWKNNFRVIDYTKKISVEEDENGTLFICLKFPYSFKNTFDVEIENKYTERSQWDHTNKVRKLNLYSYNIIHLLEFVKEHKFEIDDSFYDAVSQTEEIWNQQDTIVSYAEVDHDTIKIVNPTEYVLDFWNKNKSEYIEKDMLLAKGMGLTVRINKPITLVEKIASVEETNFWIKDYDKFFDLYKTVEGVVCVIVDRNTQNTIGWLDQFVRQSDAAGISRTDIKVCFRDPDSKKSNLNQWIKDNCVGGAVSDGKLLIFQHKPAKWLFKENVDVKIIATNSFTPITEPLTAAWISSHYCVCYLGDIRPTKFKDKKVVEL